MPRKARPLDEQFRHHALTYPGAWEDFPWGERVVKVGKKIFVFLGVEGSAEVGLTVKLPQSREEALSMPFTEVPGYGLGKAGWVTARFATGDAAPLDILTDWIDESYRTV